MGGLIQGGSSDGCRSGMSALSQLMKDWVGQAFQPFESPPPIALVHMAEAIDAGSGSANLFVSGVTTNQPMGLLPANSWLLRLLLRDENKVGGNIGLGTALGQTDILSLQEVPDSGTYSLTVDITSFSI